MCNICQLTQGEITPPGDIIYRNESIIITHSIDVKIPGYVLLSSFRHVPSLDELTDEEMTALGLWMKRITAALKTIEGVERVHYCSYCEETPHVHLHFFPRYNFMSERQYPVFSQGKLNSPALFNYFREKYKTPLEIMNQDPGILSTVNFLRLQFKKHIEAMT